MSDSTAQAAALTPDELAAWLRLALTPGVGNATARRLLARCGTAEAIFQQGPAAWGTCASGAQVQALSQMPDGAAEAIATTGNWLQAGTAERGHALIPLGDPRYPPALLQIEDPPLMLYAVGPAAVLGRAAPLIESTRTLAIVGSRNPTAQGRENAQQFAQTLVQQGWCVVSGMALGVDTAAHTGALAGALVHPAARALCTVAVIGTGIDRVYPRQNQALAHQIAERGLLLSEYPLGTPPLAENFPKRNRLIAGLSAGTLVAEAALASGSLITARLAAEQGREVFAIPGSIHAPQSKGCHALLRQGAKLVETVQDILEEWPAAQPAPSISPAPAAAAPALHRHPATEHPVLAALGFDPIGLDQLQARTGWPTPALQAWLLEQELEGAVARLPGGVFQRLVRG